MHGICYHCGAVSQRACNELERQQYGISHTADECHLVYFFLAIHDLIKIPPAETGRIYSFNPNFCNNTAIILQQVLQEQQVPQQELVLQP